MKSKCLDCANFNECQAASGVVSMVMLSCPDYVRGKAKNPIQNMKMLGESYFEKPKTEKKRRTKKQITQSQNDALSHAIELFEKLPPLFTPTEFKEKGILLFGEAVPMTKELRKEYLRPNGKGKYINKLSKAK
jgi:hypothetical protein